MRERLKRLGRFHIAIETVEQHRETIRLLMSELIILEAELHYDTHSVHYLAESKMFDEVPEHCMAPDYRIEIKMDFFVALKIKPTDFNTASFSEVDYRFPILLLQCDGNGDDHKGRVRLLKELKEGKGFDVVANGLTCEQGHETIELIRKEQKEGWEV